jgi:hypothetical protein
MRLRLGAKVGRAWALPRERQIWVETGPQVYLFSSAPERSAAFSNGMDAPVRHGISLCQSGSVVFDHLNRQERPR